MKINDSEIEKLAKMDFERENVLNYIKEHREDQKFFVCNLMELYRIDADTAENEYYKTIEKKLKTGQRFKNLDETAEFLDEQQKKLESLMPKKNRYCIAKRFKGNDEMPFVPEPVYSESLLEIEELINKQDKLFESIILVERF